ncbi:MAG: hypothetical protein LBO81_01255 [Clostridiales Family XIII bacterium]|jgi:hypothetical protein|nr:hypothetical protein [Clostridiales Family XIII bacterium]
MADATITYRVDLAVSFTDRTTGRPAVGSVTLTRDGANAHFRTSPDGFALFTNTDRADFMLGVSMSGYEREEIWVEYASLDARLPYLEAYLIPQDAFGEDYMTVDAGVAGLTAADAVCAEASAWIVSDVDARKRLMTVQNIHRKEIGGRHYGIVAKDGTSYVPIEIQSKTAGEDVYRTDVAPKEDVTGLRLAHRVTGRVRDGTCLLRIPGRRKVWILRAEIEGKSEFRLLDMDETAGRAIGGRMGIDEIMSRPAPDMSDTRTCDAAMKGG